MKYMILALLVACSMSATAGKPTKEQILDAAPAETNAAKPCGSADSLKRPTADAQKGLNAKGGKQCDDGAVGKPAPAPGAPSGKSNQPSK